MPGVKPWTYGAHSLIAGKCKFFAFINVFHLESRMKYRVIIMIDRYGSHPGIDPVGADNKCFGTKGDKSLVVFPEYQLGGAGIVSGANYFGTFHSKSAEIIYVFEKVLYPDKVIIGRKTRVRGFFLSDVNHYFIRIGSQQRV